MYNNRQYNAIPEHEKHIRNEEEYRNAIRNLRKGERWKMDDLMSRSDIDFNYEQYTPYDYGYMVNALYTDYDISERPDQYMKMAKQHLKNDSFPERGGERAYYDAQNRARRYNNTNNNQYNYGYNRNYNEQNTYRDRDNDGRYNER